jgi:hypothetical protein
MRVITSLAGASALCLAAPSCKGGEGRSADAGPERPVAQVQAHSAEEDPPGSPLAVVLDPDDEAFDRSWEGEDAGSEARAKDPATGAQGHGPEYTVKGVLRKADPATGLIVVDQLLSGGGRHDVRFYVDKSTSVGWSKASMEMGLEELPPGITIYVTYQVVGKGESRRNRALKVIIPGGMEDVAKMILAEPESATQGSKPPAKK